MAKLNKLKPGMKVYAPTTVRGQRDSFAYTVVSVDEARRVLTVTDGSREYRFGEGTVANWQYSPPKSKKVSDGG